jgi:hypothetical protein
MTCRSYEEYQEMFMLEQDFLGKGTILDIASGASSFTAELNQRGFKAMAVDPLYKLSIEEIGSLGRKEIKIASQKLSQNENLFVWNYYNSLEHHDDIRNCSLNQFINSYKRDEKKKYTFQQDCLLYLLMMIHFHLFFVITLYSYIKSNLILNSI